MCCHVHQLQTWFFSSSRDWCNTAGTMKLLGSTTGPLGLCKPPWHFQRGALCPHFSLRTKTTTSDSKESVKSFQVWKIAMWHFTFPQNIRESLKRLLCKPFTDTPAQSKTTSTRASVGNATAQGMWCLCRSQEQWELAPLALPAGTLTVDHEWLQVGCCGSTAGVSGASAELCTKEGGSPLSWQTPRCHRLLGCFAGCWQPLGLCVWMDQADRSGAGAGGKVFAEHPVKLRWGVER